MQNTRTPFRFKDYMGRIIDVDDIIIWTSSGYYSNDIKYGRVLKVDNENIALKVLNKNRNKVTLRNGFNCVILAKYPNYDLIPTNFLNKLDIFRDY